MVEIRCSTKQRVGVYVRTTRQFLLGIRDREGQMVKEPVDELDVSGLGAAASMAVAVASRMEQRKFATIEKIETTLNAMKADDGKERQVPAIKISLKVIPEARDRKRKDDEDQDDEQDHE